MHPGLEATGTHVEAYRSHKVLQMVKHNCGMDIWSGGDIIITMGSSNSRRETQFDSRQPTKPVRHSGNSGKERHFGA